LLYENPRFVGGPIELASAMSWAEADAAAQFRVKDLGRDTGGGTGAAVDRYRRGDHWAEADAAAQFRVKDLGRAYADEARDTGGGTGAAVDRYRRGDHCSGASGDGRGAGESESTGGGTAAEHVGKAALVLELEVRSPAHVSCPLAAEQAAAIEERAARRGW